MTKPESRRQRTDNEAVVIAAKRLHRARQARDSLLEFTHLTMPNPAEIDNPDLSRYEPAPHHKLIADALEEVERGDNRRLIITMPPRHGKTELASRRFPAWFTGRDPYRETIFATYNQTFAEDIGRNVRHVMSMPEYRQVFPGAALRAGSASVERLETTEGGSIFFSGIGGAMAGRGADLLVIDDPIKNREDAESVAMRRTTWDWFSSVAYTRLMPGGRVVIILTRWHEDDIVGRIFNSDYVDPEQAKLYKVLSLPAINKRGEALWPERYPVSELNGIRNTLQPRDWSALYMQSPTPDDGAFFLRKMFKGYQPSELPKNLRKFGASDHAVGLDQQNDASVLGCVGVDEDDTIWILPDVAWGRYSGEDQVEELLAQAARHKPIFWWAEKGHISKSLGPFLRRQQRETRNYFALEEMTPTVNKLARARSIMAYAAIKQIRVPTFMAWWPDALEELMKFPNATHDDFVDWLSWIGIGLERVRGMTPTVAKVVREYATGSAPWVIQQARAERAHLDYQKRAVGM